MGRSQPDPVLAKWVATPHQHVLQLATPTATGRNRLNLAQDSPVVTRKQPVPLPEMLIGMALRRQRHNPVETPTTRVALTIPVGQVTQAVAPATMVVLEAPIIPVDRATQGMILMVLVGLLTLEAIRLTQGVAIPADRVTQAVVPVILEGLVTLGAVRVIRVVGVLPVALVVPVGDVNKQFP